MLDTLFMNNKYTATYFKIVEKAKNRTTDEYTEKHHIVPECFYKIRKRKGPAGMLEGDANAKTNLVRLTAREHFICHVLLIKMTSGIMRHKMVLGATGMKRSTNHQSRYLNSRLYEMVRKECQSIFSDLNLGRKHSAETRAKVSAAGQGRIQSEETKRKRSNTLLAKFRTPERLAEKERLAELKRLSPKYQKPDGFGEKISKALTGYKRGPMNDEQKLKRSVALKGKESPNKGNRYTLTEEQRAKISESNKKRIVSLETKAKISARLKARKLKMS